LAGRIEARDLLWRLKGKTIATIAQGRPNTVLEIKGARAMVATEDSPDGEPVLLSQLQAGLDRLLDTGEVTIAADSFNGSQRFSFFGAALAELYGVEVHATSPARVTVADSVLRPLLERACAQVTEPRTAEVAVADDPFYLLFRQELRDAVAAIVRDSASYKVKGTAGQLNFLWAQTPLLGVYDRYVTETPQKGYFIVFLFAHDGSGVWLSLNQGTKAVRDLYGDARYREVLEDQARTYGAYLSGMGLEGLETGPVDLKAEGLRARGYQAGSVIAKFYPAAAIADDPATAEDLRRLLSLYRSLVETLDQLDVESDPDAPEEAKTGVEAKRYRWHLRAEGRNRSVVKRAKTLQGYVCAVCGADFEAEHGELGKRAIEAHHKTPFEQLDERPTALDPRTDFDIVCATHHRMVHSKTPPLTVAQLRGLLGLI
jgi:5-methylcytosine-specific restriction protein A